MSEVPNASYLKGWNDALHAIQDEHAAEAFNFGHRTITDTQWIAKYRPVNSEVLTDIPPDTEPEYLWSQVECDDGEIVVCAGNHIVNNLGYWVTAEPHNYDVDVIDD